jgi:hypothetical protein
VLEVNPDTGAETVVKISFSWLHVAAARHAGRKQFFFEKKNQKPLSVTGTS